MNDRLGQLLRDHEFLYGVICRDATLTDIEVMAQEGYHIVWFDLEHSPQSASEALRLGRSATHLGMVPLARIPELTRSQVQVLLDGGMQVITLPDVRDVGSADRFVQLGKYPPMGERGASTTGAGTGFSLRDDPERAFREANESTHLMVMFESDEGYEALDEIVAIGGIDMVGVGPMDWGVSLGLFGDEAKAHLAPKIDRVLSKASSAGKIAVASAAGPDEAKHLRDLGVRVLFLGVDVAMRRHGLAQALAGVGGALAR